MRRPLASLALALLIAIPSVAPAAAVEPDPVDAAPSATTATPATATPAPSTSAPATLAPAGPDRAPDEPTSAPPTALEPAVPAEPAEGAEGQPPIDADGRPDPTGRYIVVLRSGTDTGSLLTRHRQRVGTRAIRSFGRAVQGFSARLDADQRTALLADPNVVAVVPDELIELTAQTTPNGITRVGTKRSAAARLDGVDQRVDADVAIVDTGIALHPDLNVVGGYDCSTSDRTKWRDVNGHGTHVAGTVAAIDNDFGVVGVAPGARLWAVKILNDTGYGLLSWYVCGLDWIAAQRDPSDASRPLFEAVNMSVAKSGTDDHTCGVASKDVLHAAICRLVASGVTVVAAAANDSGSASKRVPAAYNEVITVSALADTDGKPGGLGGPRCYSWGTYDVDDTFADFSNYGGDVDLIASGKCIWSTKPGNTYAYSSGTSMAAPAVTGAVALYKASRPTATPAQVKEALQYLGNLDWDVSTDPDSTHEKLLDVSRLGPLGDFQFAAATPSAAVQEAGGSLVIPLSISRSATYFERVRLSITSLPDGWSAALSTSSLLGWTESAVTLTLTIPAGMPAGTHQVVVTGAGVDRTRTLSIPVVIDNDAPTASPPTAVPGTGEQVGVSPTMVPSSVGLRVSWPAATDPSSAIVGYEVQRRVNGGAWSDTRAFSAATRTTLVRGLVLSSVHRFRVRARDAVGNWSPWSESIDYSFRAVGDRSSSLRYAGTWNKATVASATDKVRTTATRAGATITTTVTGRGISLVMPRSSIRGKVTVYVDGVKVATVDTYWKSAQARRVVWSTRWSTVATRKIVIRVSGTSGRPTVSLDGLLIQK